MPKTSISEAEERRALAELEKRVEHFRPTGEEEALIEQMEVVHMTETSAGPSDPPPANLRYLVSAWSESLSALANKKEERFLGLGDLLALRFHRSLQAFLSLHRTLFAHRSASNLELVQVRRHGGAFLQKALERGVIAGDGTLMVSAIVPEVLFRYRWRHLGGLSSTAELSAVEKRALFDFTARFGPKKPEARRLDAVNQLKKLDGGYDATVAEALVLYEAGRIDAALKVLDTARKAGGADGVIDGFIEILRQ